MRQCSNVIKLIDNNDADIPNDSFECLYYMQGFTTGSTNACLFNWNPQYYYVVASELEPRSRPITKVDGLYTQWVERWRPVYRKKEAIIYSGTAVIA